MREAWAARMAELVAAGRGRLVCLEFPLDRPLEAEGPPWALRESIYRELLEPVGFERLARITPKSTHAIGYSSDGELMDRISVWARK